MNFLKRTWAEINLDNVAHNLQAIRSVCKKPLTAVIKANAYGHGAVKMAQFYNENGIDRFAVSNIEEAIELRQGGISGEILILGYTPCNMADELSKHNITQAVFSYEYAKQLSASTDARLRINIKLDTGMGRIGLDCRSGIEGCLEEIHRILTLKNLSFEGVFTHFSSADSTLPDDQAYSQQQYCLFSQVVAALRAKGYSFLAHCCNSAGTLLYPDNHCDVVRPGIILYGLSPSSDMVSPIPLKPVMTLKTVVSMIKKVDNNTCLSYGRTFRCPGPMTVATLPAGYADGYPRILSNKAEVLINGCRARVLGRVCMDQMLIDVTDIPSVKVGDEVVLFGEKDITADSVAALAGTIGYELVCNINRRVTRVYMKNNKVCDIYKMI